MTSSTHVNGTERCAEVIAMPHYGEYEVVINIQGDEPFIQPEQIDLLASCFMDDAVQIATLVRLFVNEAEKANPSRVKAFTDKRMDAVTFSRSAHPDRLETFYRIYKHIGLYAFRKRTLQQVVKLPLSPLEKEESLEQLRWLENGYHIHCAITNSESISIDTPEDLQTALKSL
jgi:3-deoxy-manno-octulosonate cytidylyltransferase (CMP-KDO synthetase)